MTYIILGSAISIATGQGWQDDAIQVDGAGNTIKLHDCYTADTTDVYLFITVLPCSCKVYIEACENMKSEW